MCSGAFGLQGIAVKLVEPFRTENYGIPAGKIACKVSHFAMDTAWNVDLCNRIYATTEGDFMLRTVMPLLNIVLPKSSTICPISTLHHYARYKKPLPDLVVLCKQKKSLLVRLRIAIIDFVGFSSRVGVHIF